MELTRTSTLGHCLVIIIGHFNFSNFSEATKLGKISRKLTNVIKFLRVFSILACQFQRLPDTDTENKTKRTNA